MPNIFDNIHTRLLTGLRNVLSQAQSCAFCVGYLNLRGWAEVADLIERLPEGKDAPCRLLVGMHRPPEEEMRQLQSLHRRSGGTDGPTLARLKRRMTESFKEQLEFGVPSNDAEAALRQLAKQLRAGKVRVKAFLRYPLHAKLYLVRRSDPATPLIGFVGSSNLTLAGLSHQGELNVDVVEQDAAKKLQDWFDQRWNDELAFDISEELARLIETSWAGIETVRPYLVYLKIAFHLCEDARQGEREFKLPKVFQNVLLDFQAAAVSLAAHHLHRHGGVLLGDVVGLGKTLMATAVAKIFQEDDDSNTLIICPPKLQPMWEQHLQQYQLTGRVLSLGKVIEELGRADAPRYRLVVIDESHNLRNREGSRYRAIAEYINRNEPRVVLVTATPYNKQYTDLSNQLRLFLDEEQDLHVRPERFFQAWAAQGKQEVDFMAQYQASPSSLRAFEQSLFPEDWRDLMRLFLVRRTRHFIIKNYAKFDDARQRYYVTLNGQPAYFPVRQPRTLEFAVEARNPSDQYARLFSDDTVAVIENLALPRYGLAKYLVSNAEQMANGDEKRILDNLNRAGRRLIGFCRTNLFKRLESSGFSFLLSVQRHVLRNMVTLHALENGLPLPIGTQNAAMLDTLVSDADEDFTEAEDTTETAASVEQELPSPAEDDVKAFRKRAADVYENYRSQFRSRFQWLDPKFFAPELKKRLLEDAEALLSVLKRVGAWQPDNDEKLAELHKLLVKTHRNDKVLVFTQFADTALYLGAQLQKRGLTSMEVATNETADPVALARRFSPATNGGLRNGESELRVLIATDVLAEGQNLQDAHTVVNYDLPWAIIRLIQRAGRVDRIGQKHDTIFAYSFLPADGVEQIIRLRARLFHRLQQNQEVIGTDESFFGEDAANKLRDLYTEKAGVLDDDRADEDIDLASLALQVWNSASADDQKAAQRLPPVVPAAAPLPESADPLSHPPGVIAYLRFPDNTDALVRVDDKGNLVSQSLSAIFRAAACAPDTPPLPRAENHHELVSRCAEIVMQEQTTFSGQLGSLRSVSRKVYDRLNRYRRVLQAQPTLFTPQLLAEIERVIDMLFRFQLKESARDALSRQIRLGITDEALADMTIRMAADDRLCQITEAEQAEPQQPKIVCSLGLRPQPPNRP
jgi:superfamily II DNA or RNA helicase